MRQGFSVTIAAIAASVFTLGLSGNVRSPVEPSFALLPHQQAEIMNPYFKRKPAFSGYQSGYLRGGQKRKKEKSSLTLSPAERNALLSRYDLDPQLLKPRQRDPFNPLILPGGKINRPLTEEEKKALKERERERLKKASSFRRFGKELKTLKKIPLELYLDLSETDNRLFRALEKYARMFREKKELLRMDKKAYFGAVRSYRRAIDKALKIGKRAPRTPLQKEYKTLKLVGTIWGQRKQAAALIETPDKKGHTVRPGTLVGPKFGVVEVIDKNRIVIKEAERDYLGNIQSRTQTLVKKGA